MSSAFDKVIGYETIKTELLQICDMIRNRDVYEKIGAKMPSGVLIYGDPGLGKSLMSKCFIEECGLATYTLRKNKGTEEFVDEITEIFKTAKKNAPSILFLDDMDKFANEDAAHCDADEYVAVQAGMDDVKGKDVFVIATVNSIHKLPRSLRRAGRFDRKIEVCVPSKKDVSDIIKHFMKDKKISPDVNLEDVEMMINYSSCAELETVMNEAAISSAFSREETISMKNIVGAVLRMEYNAPDAFCATSKENATRIAYHEAGHLVVCEVLNPGSVGLASLRSSGRDSLGGFIRRCKPLERRLDDALVSLGGVCAVDVKFGTHDKGGTQDVRRAYSVIRDIISDEGSRGFALVDVSTHRFPDISENINSRNEAVVQAELERFRMLSKEILIKNSEFLNKAAQELLNKETLLYSDIRKIRESVVLVSPFVNYSNI